MKLRRTFVIRIDSILSSICQLGVTCLLFAGGMNLSAQTVTVDFSQMAPSPLVKDRFGVYQTPLKTQQTIERASRLLSEAEVQDIRYEVGIGKPGALAFDQVSGTIGDLHYD